MRRSAALLCIPLLCATFAFPRRVLYVSGPGTLDRRTAGGTGVQTSEWDPQSAQIFRFSPVTQKARPTSGRPSHAAWASSTVGLGLASALCVAAFLRQGASPKLALAAVGGEPSPFRELTKP